MTNTEIAELKLTLDELLLIEQLRLIQSTRPDFNITTNILARAVGIMNDRGKKYSAPLGVHFESPSDVIVQLKEKLQRIKILEQGGYLATDDLDDSGLDLINYTIILMCHPDVKCRTETVSRIGFLSVEEPVDAIGRMEPLDD